MRFDLFQTREDAHIRKAKDYLQQANIARIEHQTAAEHHAALATMYAQRAIWLEQEIADSVTGGMTSLRGFHITPVENIKRGAESIRTLAPTQRTSTEGAA